MTHFLSSRTLHLYVPFPFPPGGPFISCASTRFFFFVYFVGKCMPPMGGRCCLGPPRPVSFTGCVKLPTDLLPLLASCFFLRVPCLSSPSSLAFPPPHVVYPQFWVIQFFFLMLVCNSLAFMEEAFLPDSSRVCLCSASYLCNVGRADVPPSPFVAGVGPVLLSASCCRTPNFPSAGWILNLPLTVFPLLPIRAFPRSESLFLSV